MPIWVVALPPIASAASPPAATAVSSFPKERGCVPSAAAPAPAPVAPLMAPVMVAPAAAGVAGSYTHVATVRAELRARMLVTRGLHSVQWGGPPRYQHWACRRGGQSGLPEPIEEGRIDEVDVSTTWPYVADQPGGDVRPEPGPGARVGDFYLNLSNFYISLTMIGAMGIVMLLVMWPMYEDKRLNLALLIGFVVVLVGAFAMARTETFVGDDAFLSSMIPHHSRAILVCQESSLTDPEIIELCESIVQSQQQEISQMKDIIERRSDF